MLAAGHPVCAGDQKPMHFKLILYNSVFVLQNVFLMASLILISYYTYLLVVWLPN